MLQPFFFGFFASRHSKDQPNHWSLRGSPRCYLYQAASFFVFRALKKMPPMPVMRGFLRGMGAQGCRRW